MRELQNEKKLQLYENIERYVYEDMGYKEEEIQFLAQRNAKRLKRENTYEEIVEYFTREEH